MCVFLRIRCERERERERERAEMEDSWSTGQSVQQQQWWQWHQSLEPTVGSGFATLEKISFFVFVCSKTREKMETKS